MHFGIHCLQQKTVGLVAALCLSGLPAGLWAQQSYSEKYLSANLPTGVNSTTRLDNESAVVLFERQIDEFRFVGEDLESFEVVHKKYQIFDEHVLGDFSTLYIPLSQVKEVLFIKARSTSPKGEVTETDVSKIKSVEEDGKPYKMLAVENVQVGGTVELIYGLRKPANLYWATFLGRQVRVLESQYWVIHPRNFTMEHHVYNTDQFTQTDSLFGAKTDLAATATLFTFPQIPAMVNLGKFFPNMPLKYRVETTMRRNSSNATGNNYEYNDVARISYDRISNAKEKGSKEIRKILSQINLKDKTTERAKIIEVESYIKRTYQKDDTQNPEANTLKYLYATKVGSESAFMALFSGIFDELGIKHEMGFVYDRTIKIVEDDGFENWVNLQEWIIRFPDSDTYILPTDMVSPPGYLGNDYRGTHMVRIKTLQLDNITSAVADLVKIPEGPEFRQKEKYTVSLDSDFAPSSKCEYTVKGNVAASLKWLRDMTLMDLSLMTNLVKNLIEGRHPDQKVKNISFRFAENYGDPDFSMSITFDLVPVELVEKAGNNYVFYPGRYYNSNVTATDFPAHYQYPVMAKENAFTELEMRIPIPDGYKVDIPKEPLPSVKLDLGEGRSLLLEAEIKAEDDNVTVTIREEQKVGKLDVKDLSKLKTFMEQSEKMSKIYFVLTKA